MILPLRSGVLNRSCPKQIDIEPLIVLFDNEAPAYKAFLLMSSDRASRVMCAGSFREPVWQHRHPADMTNDGCDVCRRCDKRRRQCAAAHGQPGFAARPGEQRTTALPTRVVSGNSRLGIDAHRRRLFRHDVPARRRIRGSRLQQKGERVPCARHDAARAQPSRQRQRSLRVREQESPLGT